MPSTLSPDSDRFPAAPPTAASWLDGPPSAPPSGPPTPPFGYAIPPIPPPAPQNPPPQKTPWAALAVVGVFALLVGALAGGLVSLSLRPAGSSAALSSDPGVSASSTPSTSAPSSGSGSGSSGGSSSPKPLSTVSEVAAAVDPGVVDIESRLPGGVGAGTGMVLTDSGEILTNNHVVAGATQIAVTVTSTGETYSASVVGTDAADDVAVIKIDGASGLTPVPLGDSDTVQVGDEVVAIGNAGGQGGEPTAVSGKVVDLHQQITASEQDGSNAETLTDMIQVSAQVVPGDSGGPLANTSGQVIGIDAAASSGSAGRGSARFHSGGSEGFAIPINKALSIAKQLESGSGGSSSGSGSSGSGRQSSGGGFLGVVVQDGTGGGAEITGVQSGSPAADAGLAVGDVIVGIDRSAVQTPDDLVSLLSDYQPGDQVTVTWQDARGRSHRTTVTLGSR